ncbi:MAG: Gfo/Idh/MocA family protein [Planctomycetota bacterium]
MDRAEPVLPTRRDFLKQGGLLAASSALASAAVPHVHAAGSERIQLALIGCGGRGTGAAIDAFGTEKQGPVELVAMADAFADRLDSSYKNLSRSFAEKVDVPAERRFVGYDAYRKAVDCLRPGDIAILATPPAFRWVHLAYALKKGVHVFMEKPITVDGPTSRRMLEQAKEATAKNLKIGVGLMSRHSRALEELARRIQDGELGQVILMRGYRMHGPLGFFASLPKPGNVSELEYQVRRFHSFLWSGGGCFSDFYIHIIDHLCWLKGAWPVKAQALGGRHYKRSPEGVEYVDQNFDTYSVEYTFADGTKFYFDGRCMEGCTDIYSSAIHGTKGMAIASSGGDCGLPSRIYKSQSAEKDDLVWESKVPPDQQNPYRNEWNDLVAAIRNDKPYNELERGVIASLVTSLGRMAAHTGREITYDEILASDHEFAPGLDQLTAESEAPVRAGPDGKYPVPEPGRKKREY